MSKTQQYFILIPLSLLVIITVLAVLGANLGYFGNEAIESTLAKWGPAGALAQIIGLYIFIGKAIFSKKRAVKYSILIAPPIKLQNLDILDIDWDNNECWAVVSNLQERIKLVPSMVGSTFRVHLPKKIISFISKNSDEPIELRLKDRKGNEWAVKPFFLYENLQNLTILEDLDKIIKDYGEEQ